MARIVARGGLPNVCFGGLAGGTAVWAVWTIRPDGKLFPVCYDLKSIEFNVSPVGTEEPAVITSATLGHVLFRLRQESEGNAFKVAPHPNYDGN
jgi:hypothetical protein